MALWRDDIKAMLRSSPERQTFDAELKRLMKK